MTAPTLIFAFGGFTYTDGTAYVKDMRGGGARGVAMIAWPFQHRHGRDMSLQPVSGASEAKLQAIPRTTALALVVAGYVTFLNMWCTQAILPVLAKSLHVSEAATGYTVTAPLLATAAMAPLIGMISDRFGRRIFIRGAALLLVVPTVLAAFSPNLGVLIACRFMQGLLLPFIFTVIIAYISDEMSPAASMRMVGIYTSGTISGGFSGRLVVGLVTSVSDWRAGILAVGLITLTAALIVAFCLPKERRFKPTYGLSGALSSFPNHLTNMPLVGTYAVGFGVLFSIVSIFTFINFRLAEPPYNMGPGDLGAIFVVYLGGVVVSPVIGRLMVTVDRRWLMTGCVGLLLAGMALTLARPLYLICLGLLLFCLGLFPQQTLGTGVIGVVAKGAKSTAVGLYVTIYYIGGSFGGFFTAFAWHGAGWGGCVAVTSVVQVMMLGLAWTSWRPERLSPH